MAGAIISTVSCHWGTPVKLLESVRSVFGGQIDLDPCGNRYATERVNAAHQIWLKEEAEAVGFIDGNPYSTLELPENVHIWDGLEYDWTQHKNVFCNPPYGRDALRGTSIYTWIKKCVDVGVRHETEVIALIPAAVDTKHWHELVFPTFDAICFLKGRVKFLLPGKTNASTVPSAMVYWGRDVELFQETFKKLGKVFIDEADSTILRAVA